MKAILLPIKPKWVAKIFNKEKIKEVRKKFPKDYVGWIYIYCTKDRLGLYWADKWVAIPQMQTVPSVRNGKIVARFWCDKVESYEDVCYWSKENEKATCLNPTEFFDYLNNIRLHRSCSLINITQLEIFEKPKELCQFKTPKNYERYQKELEQSYADDAEIMTRLYEGCANDDECANNVELTELIEYTYGLQKAPQSFCYVEVEL